MDRLLKLSDEADEDLILIWAYTAKTYDLEQAVEYTSLIHCALDDIEEDPERPTSRNHPEYGTLVRSYHIEYSKRRSGTRVRSPRHLILYTLKYDGLVLVLRILKDDMDPPRHIKEWE